MPSGKIITPGTRFARWTALEKTEIRSYPSKVSTKFTECRCDCGTVQFVADTKLRSGHSRSCGCLQAEVTVKRNLIHGYSGFGGARVYNVWNAMWQRCTNPKTKAYPDYGGRGITVCERWRNFENFLADMGEPPIGYTIDRTDNNGNYCKENCAWRTPVHQARNRRNSIVVTFNGLTMTLIEWSERLGLSYKMVRARYANGWPVERILTEPKNGKA